MHYSLDCSVESLKEGENVTSEAIDFMNKGLNLVGISPIKKKLIKSAIPLKKVLTYLKQFPKKFFILLSM